MWGSVAIQWIQNAELQLGKQCCKYSMTCLFVSVGCEFGGHSSYPTYNQIKDRGSYVLIT